MITRRGFLAGIIAAGVAPIVLGAGPAGLLIPKPRLIYRRRFIAEFTPLSEGVSPLRKMWEVDTRQWSTVKQWGAAIEISDLEQLL